jgi:hypothetical protein
MLDRQAWWILPLGVALGFVVRVESGWFLALALVGNLIAGGALAVGLLAKSFPLIAVDDEQD